MFDNWVKMSPMKETVENKRKRVTHRLYGVGTVIDARPDAGTVTVKWDSHRAAAEPKDQTEVHESSLVSRPRC